MASRRGCFGVQRADTEECHRKAAAAKAMPSHTLRNERAELCVIRLDFRYFELMLEDIQRTVPVRRTTL